MDDELSLVDWIKGNRGKTAFICLVFIAFLSFFIRIQNFPRLGNELLEFDSYLFYRYANYIVQDGKLPEVDTMRNYPHGWNPNMEATLTAWVVAFVYKFFHFFIPNFTVIQASQLYPPLATFVSVFFFYLFVKEIFKNRLVALLSCLFLILIPGYLFRTISGFGDKEGFAMLAFFVSFYLYAKSLKSNGLLLSFLSGFVTGLVAWAWGGYRFMTYSIIFLFMIGTLISNHSKRDILRFAVWLGAFVIFLSILSDRYNLYTETFFIFAMVGLVGSLIDVFILSKLKFNLARKIPHGVLSIFLGVLLIGGVVWIVMGYNFIFNEVHAFIDMISNPMSSGIVSTSVQENQPSWFIPDWWGAFSFFFFPFFFGSVIFVYEITKGLFPKRAEKKDEGAVKSEVNVFDLSRFKPFLIPLVFLFCQFIFIFSKYRVGESLTNWLSSWYQVSILAFIIFVGYVFFDFYRRGELDKLRKLDKASVLVIVWYTLCVLGARGTVRLVFVLVPPAAIFGSYFLVWLADFARRRTRDPLYFYIPYALIIGLILMFFNSAYASAHFYIPSTGSDWDSALSWINENTTVNDVFIHWWDYGYWVQGVANRTTVSDGGHPETSYGDYLIGRHLFSGYNISEVREQLEFNGNPDYLFIVGDDIGKFYQMSRIGERMTYYSMIFADRVEKNTIPALNSSQFDKIIINIPTQSIVPIQQDFMFGDEFFAKEQSVITAVLIPLKESAGLMGEPVLVVANARYGQVLMQAMGICTPHAGCNITNPNGVPGFVLLVNRGMYWIPENAINMFMTNLYLIGREIPGFELVYESPADIYDMATMLSGDRQNIRIYKLDYTAMDSAVNSNYSWSIS